MALTYATYVTALSELLTIDPVDPNFLNILPDIIDYAEQRLYRELDILNTVVTDSSAALTSGNRNFTLPQSNGRFVVTNGFNVYTPAGSTNSRVQLIPVSRDVLDAIYPSADGADVPSMIAMITDQTVIVGPWPDANYTVEVIGTIRPTPLSATNTTTYLTLYLPDLMVAASMIFASGYQQNFGAQSDNPQMASSWEGQYEKLIPSAGVEEQRKRYASGAWGSLSPTPIATPTR